MGRRSNRVWTRRGMAGRLKWTWLWKRKKKAQKYHEQTSSWR